MCFGFGLSLVSVLKKLVTAQITIHVCYTAHCRRRQYVKVTCRANVVLLLPEFSLSVDYGGFSLEKIVIMVSVFRLCF